MRSLHASVLLAVFASLAPTIACDPSPDEDRLRIVAGGAVVAETAYSPDEETVVAPRHFEDGYPARNDDGSVNAMIEIPAGTSAKFEVNHDSGELEWEYRDGRPRMIRYLAYPANYGMIPSTLQSAADGGDGDALDVVVLGPALPRGAIVSVRPIGVLKLMDDGERDDKLIAVPLSADPGRVFAEIRETSELDEHYPGAREILELWFSNYKGRDIIQVTGWGDADEAARVLAKAEADYR